MNEDDVPPPTYVKMGVTVIETLNEQLRLLNSLLQAILKLNEILSGTKKV